MSKTSGMKQKKTRSASDLVAKILCVVFAFLLWFYVMLVESPADEQVIHDVPIVVDAEDPDVLAQGLSVYAEQTETVDVTISGKRRVLSRITAADILVKADLSGVDSATVDLTVPLSITVPEGCQLVSATKYNTQVHADTLKKTLIPLITELENPNPSYIYGGTPTFSIIRDGEKINVTAVSVEGPSSVVNQIAYGELRIDVSGKERSFTDSYTIDLVDERGIAIDESFLKKEFDVVNVTMSVEIEKEVPLTYSFKQGYFTDTETMVTFSPSTVTVRCAPADAHRVDLVSTIELDERKLLTEESIQQHMLETDVRLVSPYAQKIIPEQVTMTWQIDPQFKIRKMLVSDIQSMGGIDVDCNILDDSLENVILCGSTEHLSALDNADLIAVVDLGEYSEEHIGNRYRKKVMIVIDSEVADRVFVIGEYTVEIEITGKK